MDKLLSDFAKTKTKIFKSFNCPNEYFLKNAPDCMWKISAADGVTFLSYTSDGKNFSNCVVVNYSGNPMIYTNGSYTMVIAIECIKTAIIFKTANKIG